MTGWQLTEEMSLDREPSKRVLIYYAAPWPERYGYFSSTSSEARDRWLKRTPSSEIARLGGVA